MRESERERVREREGERERAREVRESERKRKGERERERERGRERELMPGKSGGAEAETIALPPPCHWLQIRLEMEAPAGTSCFCT